MASRAHPVRRPAELGSSGAPLSALNNIDLLEELLELASAPSRKETVLKLTRRPPETAAAETPLLALFCFADGDCYPPLELLDEGTAARVRELSAADEFGGKAGRLELLRPAAGPRRLLLVGLGERDDLTVERLHEAVVGIVGRVEKLGLKTFSAAPPPLGDGADFAAHHLGLAAGLATFRFDRYRSAEQRERPRVEELSVLGNPELDAALHRAAIVARAQNFARELVSEPVNVLTPVEFARRVAERAAEVGLQVEVHDAAWIRRQGMELIWAVARGAAEEPRFVVLRHHGADGDKPALGLVGKGVMFDSGGYNLKGSGMELMKGDMGGSAAVVGAMLAAAELELPVDVLAVVPAVVNAVDGNAYKPSDVIKSFAGPSVEIGNTDAEGRLTLADGLSWAREQGAERLLDICTLTGASMVALGVRVGALLTNDELLRDKLLGGVERTGELFWELPLFEHYAERLESDIAEIKSTGGKPAGTISAAKFLERFAGDTPWAHLDIAGKEFTDKPYGPYRKGATGFGVRTLVELLESL